MKEVSMFKTMQPVGAEGNVCISYTDPVTNKIKEQIKGKNHVFSDAWFQLSDWWEPLRNVRLVATDSTLPIDTNFPYLLGNPIGQGIIGAVASGTYQGAWNSVNGFVVASAMDGVSSKLSFDFTPIQVPSAVRTIGLTEQYDMRTRTYFKKSKLETWGHELNGVCDRDYFYSISSGVVTKVHLLSRIASTIDISAIVGTTNLYIGIDQTTGNLYVRKYDAVAANRRMFKFSDGTFGILLDTYSPSNDSRAENFYVYGDCAFSFSAYNSVVKSNFVSNIAPQFYSVTHDTILGLPNTPENSYRLIAASGKYLLFPQGGGYNFNFSQTAIFNMDTCLQAGIFLSTQYYKNYTKVVHSVSDYGAIVQHTRDINGGAQVHPNSNIALACYKVPDDAPARPAGYGMNLTYELKVFL